MIKSLNVNSHEYKKQIRDLSRKEMKKKGICEVCEKKGKTEWHHKNPELYLVDNVEELCIKCYGLKHRGENRKRDPKGNVLIQLDLDEKEDKIVSMYKIEHKLKDKKIAIKKIIKELDRREK